MPLAEVIQCTDDRTPEVADVTKIHRQSGDTKNLMTFRLACFSGLGLTGPAAYIDTDMIMIRTLDPDRVIGDYDVAVCERSFGREDTINTSFKGMDLSEYTNKTFGEIYPYLACFTVVRGHSFWQSCYDELQKLPEKFRYWYGDQEAIRNVVNYGDYRVKMIPERIYGCLPEYLERFADAPRMLHFKGARRKKAMLEYEKRFRRV